MGGTCGVAPPYDPDFGEGRSRDGPSAVHESADLWIGHRRLFDVYISHGGLLVETVDFFEFVISHGLGYFVSDVVDGLFKVSHLEPSFTNS